MTITRYKLFCFGINHLDRVGMSINYIFIPNATNCLPLRWLGKVWFFTLCISIPGRPYCLITIQMRAVFVVFVYFIGRLANFFSSFLIILVSLSLGFWMVSFKCYYFLIYCIIKCMNWTWIKSFIRFCIILYHHALLLVLFWFWHEVTCHAN